MWRHFSRKSEERNSGLSRSQVARCDGSPATAWRSVELVTSRSGNGYQYILWRGGETSILRQFVGELDRSASALKACRLPAYGVHDGAKLVVCSEELAEMFGASSPAEIVGRDVILFIGPEERDRSIAAMTGGPTEPYLSVGVRLDGTTFPMRIESAAVRSNERGEARIVMIRDLSPVAVVVDDEAPVARMAAMLMRYAGYQPVTYTSARQALVDFQPGGASVIVTDVLMPEMDGVSMAKAMREIDPLVPVVFVSGYTNIAVPQDAGMAFVRKPFGMADLKRAIESLPERARKELE